MADFFAATATPGLGAASMTSERMALLGPPWWYLLKGVVLDTSASDAGNSPTTELRHGLLMGKLSSNGFYQHYQPNVVTGPQVVEGFLWMPRRTIDTDGNSVNRDAQIVIAGYVKSSQLLLLDENARRQMQSRFVFDDRPTPIFGGWTQVIPKTANYTVVAGGLNTPGDNNTHFTTTGNAAAITFTLPAVAKGNRFRFTNTVDQNMTIAGPANTLVVFNNAAATSIAVQTVAQKIGASFEVTANDDGTKWLVLPYVSGHTVTVA